MHCENKNCEILKYADKKKCGIVEYEHVASSVLLEGLIAPQRASFAS